MMEKIELCTRAIRFTPLLGALDLLFILHFFLSWYRSTKKTGWKIDFWFLNLFLACVLNTCLLYPFSASSYHAIMAPGFYEKLEPLVDRAFLISLLGYAFVWVGRYWHDLTANRGILGKLLTLFLPFSNAIERNIKSSKVVFALTCAAFLLGGGLFLLQFQAGEFFKRAWDLPQERFIAPVLQCHGDSFSNCSLRIGSALSPRPQKSVSRFFSRFFSF